MLIKHCLDKDEIKKKSDESSNFLLTNKIGGYLSLSNNVNYKSRYHGWFFISSNLVGQKLFKVIEDIKLVDAGELLEVKNNFWNIQRKYNRVVEKFFIPNNQNSLVYQLNKKSKLELFLDIKESYDNQEFGRFYEIFEEDKVIVIKCINNNNIFYLAIKSNSLDYFKIGDWILQEYQLDKKRGVGPFERYVYKALIINAQKIVFSINFNKGKAIKEAKTVFKNIQELEKIEKKYTQKVLALNKNNFNNKEIEFAYLSAKNSLDSLIIQGLKKDKLSLAIYAGLPWFFQFWSRDELISLKVLDKKIQKKILLRQFKNLENIYDLDSIGWLFFRAAEFMNETNDVEIKEKLLNSLDKFEISKIKLTWMDTLSRPYGIDLYALKLAIYKLVYKQSNDLDFLKKEKKLFKYVRENFWNGKILADTPNNFLIRSNIFLVAYIYPELLSKKEWITCFENSLVKLWLDWGGVATVDKSGHLFVSQNTGHNPKSYHNGDSWFWINNLTALILARLDKKRFKKQIEKILKTSINEILWKGTIGHHTEISSANEFKSEGCWAQSWSNALYIELINYILEIKNQKSQ